MNVGLMSVGLMSVGLMSVGFMKQHPQNYPSCTLLLVVETFGHSTERTNQSNFNKSRWGC